MTSLESPPAELSIEQTAEALGQAGPGIAYLPGGVDSNLLQDCREQLEQSDLWSIPRSYFLRRPNVRQQYEKISLIVGHGDQAVLENQLSSVLWLRAGIGRIAVALSEYYPSLMAVDFNDIDLHRYPGSGGCLDMHKDYPRNPLLIAVATVSGDGCFMYGDGNDISLSPGDVVLMRAPGLYETDEDIRPLHGFVAGRNGRSCVVLRHDPNPTVTRPYDSHYDNWPDQFYG